VITFVIKKPAVAPATPQNTERVDPNSTRPREVEFSLKAVSKIDTGFLVAGVLDQRLAIWKQDGKEFFEVGFLKSNRGSVSARFSADGKFFATSGADIEPRVFEVTKTGLSPVTEVAKSRVSLFSPSSKYLLARNTDSLTIWDLGNRKEIKTLAMPLSATQLVFALDSDLFVIVYNHSAVTVRSCATGEPVFEELKINDISPPVILGREAKSLVLSTSEYSDTYEKYSLETAQKTGELDLGGRSLGTVAGDGDSLLISEDDLVRLWQIPPIKPSENVARVAEDGQRIEALNQNGSIMLLSDNDEWSGAAGKFQVKDITQNKEFFSFSEKSSLYKLSPDGNWVAARTNDNEVKLFSAAESQNPPKLSFNNRVSQITYSSDGRFLAVWTEDAQPHIFDTKSGVTSNLETADFDPVSLSFTPNSQYLVASMRGPSGVDKSVVTPAVEPGKPTLAIWSIASGKKILPTLNDKERVDAVAISNNRIAISQTKKIHLFDITTGNEIREFAYPGDLALLSLREDGKLMGTCDRDGVLQLWDADEGKAGSTISLGSAAYQMFFAADGASLVAVTTDNWAHQIDIGHTLHYASGIFTGEIDSYSIRPLGGNTITGLKFISAEVRHPHVYVKDFHSSDGVLDTKSNAQELLDKWRAKLNYYVRPDGFLANGSPGTTVSY
jgi:hypothetical protein